MTLKKYNVVRYDPSAPPSDDLMDTIDSWCVAFCDKNYGKYKLDQVHHFIDSVWAGSMPLWLAYDEEGKVVGLICGFIYTNPLTGTRTLNEMFFYSIAPGAGAGLLFAFEEYGQREQVEMIALTLQHNDDIEAIDRYYTNRGYAKQETVYRKWLV